MKPQTTKLIELLNTMIADGDLDLVDVLSVVEFLLKIDWRNRVDPRVIKWELPKWWR